MDCQTRFQIVFQKLSLEMGEPSSVGVVVRPEVTVDELDEIRELSRLALEIREPEGQSYTTT